MGEDATVKNIISIIYKAILQLILQQNVQKCKGWLSIWHETAGMQGNKLQSVTPYKDGLTVGQLLSVRSCRQWGDASLRLMEYLEHIFYPEKHQW